MLSDSERLGAGRILDLVTSIGGLVLAFCGLREKALGPIRYPVLDANGAEEPLDRVATADFYWSSMRATQAAFHAFPVHLVDDPSLPALLRWSVRLRKLLSELHIPIWHPSYQSEDELLAFIADPCNDDWRRKFLKLPDFLNDLVALAGPLVEDQPAAVVRADNSKKFLRTDLPEVLKPIAEKLDAVGEGDWIKVAREELGNDEKRSQSLLRKMRRWRDKTCRDN